MNPMGHDAYFAIAKEAAWATKNVAGMTFMEHLSETLAVTQTRKTAGGINHSRVVTKSVPLAKMAGGDVPFEVNAEDGIGHMLLSLLPTETIVDNGAGNTGIHTFKKGNTLIPGFTCQVKKKTGYVRDFFGGQVTQLALNTAPDDVLKATAGFSFYDEEAGVAQDPVYTTQKSLTYHEGSLMLDGLEAMVTKFDLTISPALKSDRKRLFDRRIMQQLPGMYSIKGSITMPWDDNGILDAFLDHTPVGIEVNYLGAALGTGQRRLSIFLSQVFVDGDYPKNPGRDEELTLTIPFEAVETGDGSPDELIQIELENSKRTIY